MSKELFDDSIDVGTDHTDQHAYVTVETGRDPGNTFNVYLDLEARTPLTALQALEISQMLTRAAIALIAEESMR